MYRQVSLHIVLVMMAGFENVRCFFLNAGVVVVSS
jgi:hypothetical protein